MKKLFLIVVFSFFILKSTAQSGVSENSKMSSFKIGVTGGIPIGDTSELVSFVLGLDAYYYFLNVDNKLSLGVTTGFRYYFVDYNIELNNIIVEVEDVRFLPVAVASRYHFNDTAFSLGIDLGYSFRLDKDGSDGGFYFRPILGYDISSDLEINASFESISGGRTWSSVNLGILYKI